MTGMARYWPGRLEWRQCSTILKVRCRGCPGLSCLSRRSRQRQFIVLHSGVPTFEAYLLAVLPAIHEPWARQPSMHGYPAKDTVRPASARWQCRFGTSVTHQPECMSSCGDHVDEAILGGSCQSPLGQLRLSRSDKSPS